MARGPMAKHPSARARSNTHSTAREIVLRAPNDELLPVPPLPERLAKVEGELVSAEWHGQVKLAWVQMWQYPLVYEAPEVDQHLLLVYVDLLQDFWERSEKGRSRNEIARDLRAFAELWGIGEKSRRHLQITIQQANEALERGRRQSVRRVENEAAPAPTIDRYTPNWTEDDEDDGSLIADAEVVA